MNGLWRVNYKRSGFSLLEIVVAIALIVLVATMVIPRLRRKKDYIMGFTSHMNALLTRTYTNAMMTGKVHKITFDLDSNYITAEQLTGEKSPSGEDVTIPLSESYTYSSIKIPDELEIRNFFINKKDELAGDPTKKVWFFVVPQGFAQRVIINFSEIETEKPASLVLNPFTVRMKYYDEYKKPS